MSEKEQEKAKTLVEALPYIKRFFGKTIVIKYGGSLVADPNSLSPFAADVVLLKYVGIKPVIVHGGGREISRWLRRAGNECRFTEGLQLTGSETGEVAELLLAGKINGELVAQINGQGAAAVGVSGKDAGLFQVEALPRAKQKDALLTGEIRGVNAPFLATLSDSGYIPVVSSLGASDSGETLNINADHAAAAAAAALNAAKLIYLTHVDGVMRGGGLLSLLTRDAALDALLDPELPEDLRPKLECALQVLDAGVKDVHIINGMHEHAVLLELFTARGVGTMLTDAA